MTNSQISLLIYVAVLLPLMLLGFFFARRKMFTPHKLVMTTIFIANWGLILWVMSPAYRGMVSSTNPAPDFSTIPVILPTIHMTLGAIAQLMATYLVLLMWTERTPLEKLIPFRIKNIKTPMRFTLTLWIITVLMGFGIYAVWYGPSSAGTGTENLPTVTEEASAEAPNATEESEVESPAATEEAGNGETIGDGSDYSSPEEPATTEQP